jgi:DNA-binding transcriptional regulator YiaG
MVHMTIAEEIAALRTQLGESRETFGQRWYKSGRTVEAWEQGRRAPEPFVLEAIRALAARSKFRQKSRG